MSLKTHFTSDGYDYFTNHPKNATIKAYNKRSDRWVFEKLEKHSDPETLMVSNLVLNPHLWPEYLIRGEAHQNYYETRKRIESLGYLFRGEVKKCVPITDKILCEKNELPLLIRMYVRSILTLETVCIVSFVLNCFPYWDKQLKNDILWNDLRLRIKKYTPFIITEDTKTKWKSTLIDIVKGESDE